MKDTRQSSKTIRIPMETYQRIMEIVEKTRRPAGDVASEALDFALGHVKLYPAKVYDFKFVDEKE